MPASRASETSVHGWAGCVWMPRSAIASRGSRSPASSPVVCRSAGADRSASTSITSMSRVSTSAWPARASRVSRLISSTTGATLSIAGSVARMCSILGSRSTSIEALIGSKAK